MENATCLPSTDQAGWENLAPEGTWTGNNVALGPDSVMSTARMPAPVVARMVDPSGDHRQRSITASSMSLCSRLPSRLAIVGGTPILVGEVDPDERDPQAVRGEITQCILPSLR